MNDIYLDTARMMVQVAPLVFTDERLALKGGTAINLFLRELPRLSVDLDLTFTDHTVKRSDALSAISSAIRKSQARLQRQGYQTHVPAASDGVEAKLLIRRGPVEVKVEINRVIRGTVNPVRRASITTAAKNLLAADLELPILTIEDIYAGKLVAALDRQHPRDLFDVMQLFENEGLTPGIVRSFVVYLASHNRPIHEVLFPTELAIANDYATAFNGMTRDPVALSALVSTRSRLMRELPQSLTVNQRRFLISLAHAEPRWELLDVGHMEQLPAIKWKVRNLERLATDNPSKLKAQAEELERRFDY